MRKEGSTDFVVYPKIMHRSSESFYRIQFIVVIKFSINKKYFLHGYLASRATLQARLERTKSWLFFDTTVFAGKKKKSEKVNFFFKYKNCRISSKPHACVHNFENNRPRVLRFSINIEIEKTKPPADTALFMSDRRVVNWSSVTDIATQKRFRIRIIVKKKKT